MLKRQRLDGKTHEHYLRAALREARKAQEKGEVPVGAVVVREGRIVGRGHNLNITRNDPAAHAEILALRKAARKLGNYRLGGCALYVTIEPCPMCAGAMVWARIAEVVFGAYDAKAGACGSALNVLENRRLNHRVTITGGILEEECRSLIQRFFRAKRKKPTD